MPVAAPGRPGRAAFSLAPRALIRRVRAVPLAVNGRAAALFADVAAAADAYRRHERGSRGCRSTSLPARPPHTWVAAAQRMQPLPSCRRSSGTYNRRGAVGRPRKKARVPPRKAWTTSPSARCAGVAGSPRPSRSHIRRSSAYTSSKTCRSPASAASSAATASTALGLRDCLSAEVRPPPSRRRGRRRYAGRPVRGRGSFDSAAAHVHRTRCSRASCWARASTTGAYGWRWPRAPRCAPPSAGRRSTGGRG